MASFLRCFLRCYPAKTPPCEAAVVQGFSDANKVAGATVQVLELLCLSLHAQRTLIDNVWQCQQIQQHFDWQALLQCRTAWKWQFSE